jgi:hypothetical protein
MRGLKGNLKREKNRKKKDLSHLSLIINGKYPFRKSDGKVFKERRYGNSW